MLTGVRVGINPVLLKAVSYHETAGTWNTDTRGPVDEIGLMQIRPGTARMLGVTGTDAQVAAVLANPWHNLELGARYLRAQLAKYGTVPKALSAYNAGKPITGNVASYVNPVLTHLQAFTKTWRPLLILAPALIGLAGAVWLFNRTRHGGHGSLAA